MTRTLKQQVIMNMLEANEKMELLSEVIEKFFFF